MTPFMSFLKNTSNMHLLKTVPRFAQELDLTATGVTPIPFASAVEADNCLSNDDVTSLSLYRDTAVNILESNEFEEMSAFV